MQGYTWRSNHCPPPRHQERPPPSMYQERPPPPYREQFPSKYHAARNDQPNAFQAQEVTNQWSNSSCSVDSFAPAFRSNSHGYDRQTKQAHPRYPFTACNIQQHCPSENPNKFMYYAQISMQPHASSSQNYRNNTGHSEAPMYWTPQSNNGSSVANSREWPNHLSNNGNSCSMNNQPQFQSPRTALVHHLQRQRQFFRQCSRKGQRKHQLAQGQHQQFSSWGNNNQAQSQTAVNDTSCSFTTAPSGAQNNVSLPSNNLNQSPVFQNQPELRANADPLVSQTQSQNNQSAGHKSQGRNSQMAQTSWTQLEPNSGFDSKYQGSIIYKLLCMNTDEEGNKLQSGAKISNQSTCPQQFKVCATKRTDHPSKEPFSAPSEQCAVEPYSKRMKYGVVQRDYWNKKTSVSKDQRDFGVQSSLPGNHQIGSNENRVKGTSQHRIQYSTDPADCLEAVFALQKAAQQGHKAIAIVPPISQQTSNVAQTVGTSTRNAETPQLKIDSVWSLVNESDAQITVSESPSQTIQQDDKSNENETVSNIAEPETCSPCPVEYSNVQQGDSDSSEPSFDLSSVPVVKYTLKKLTDLVKSLEATELSAGYPEHPESVFDRIMKLYWNGKQDNLLEPLRSYKKRVPCSFVEKVMDFESLVFESIETENLKKLAHCDVLKNEMYSSEEEFRSSWLNVDRQPADIEKVLSEPLLDEKFKVTSQSLSEKLVVTSANVGVNSLPDLPEVSSSEKSVKSGTCSPTELFTPLRGNDKEMDSGDNGYSHVLTSLSNISSNKETFKNQEDINVNQLTNTKPSGMSPLVDRPTEKCTDNGKEVFRQEHFEQMCDNVSVLESLLLSPGDNDSDGVKSSEVTLATETICNSTDTCQIEAISDDENPGNKETHHNTSDIWFVEDISDDESPGNKEALHNSSDIWLVEDISDDENSRNKEVPPMASDIWQVEDISDDENSRKKDVPQNNADIWQVEDISDDENSRNKELCPKTSDTCQVEIVSDNVYSGNKDTVSNSPDICVVEDVSNDESSSEVPLLMQITVLSSEDAKTFFQEFEVETECTSKTKSQSSFNSPEIACFDVPSQPDREYNKADTSCRCSTQFGLTNTTNMTKTDSGAEHFCPQCWEQAPLLELEEEPCTPVVNEADVLDSPAEPNEQDENCSPLCLQLEVKKPGVVSTEERLRDERLTGQTTDRMVVSQLGDDCSRPCLQLQVKVPTVASLEECGELDENSSPPSLELECKEPIVASTEQCIANERLTGQKRDGMVTSELEQDRSSPSLELNTKESNLASPEPCIANEELTVQKSNFLEKLLLRQNCSPLCLELEDKVPNVASLAQHVGLTGQKSDSVGKSVTETMPEIQRPSGQKLTKSQPNKPKNKKAEKIQRLPNSQPFVKCNKPPSAKSTFSKHKLKSVSFSSGSDESVLFTPDIVVKKIWPQKKNVPGVSANKRPSESKNCRKVKKFKDHRQDKMSQNHRENLQKERKKVSGHSDETPLHGSENMLKLHGILSVNKTKTTESKKVRFDLYGSKTEEQCSAQERRFSAPATLTVSDSCRDYNDVLSAKEKVHNLWRSTFIPKTKKFSSKSQEEGSPQKKKTEKPQDHLKSNMIALKSQMNQRAILLSGTERKPSYFKKRHFFGKS